jgi:anti-sigma regulatory factor (Ser/Thr protein kinase)
MSLTYSWELPADSTAPGQGRWHVRELLTDRIEVADAELVVTELITNAWRYGRGPITLRAEILEDGIRIEVCSESSDDPKMRAHGPASGGRGLLLVEELSREWGYERAGGHLCVWAQVPAD